MNKHVVLALVLVAGLCLIVGTRRTSASHSQSEVVPNSTIDRKTYRQLRDEQVARLRGVRPGVGADLRARELAIAEMETKTQAAAQPVGILSATATPVWTELGPRPLANGETQDPGVTTAVSGRATAVVVDPTNSNKVYLGTAQGGVWRSLDGGSTWVTIFDSAKSLAIGALALAPSSPTTLYVGTGEHPGNIINDAFFGVGVYRIDSADTIATLRGPINPPFSFNSILGGSLTTTCFGGRAITSIAVHPTDPATILVATTGSFSGISGQTLGSDIPPLGLRGLYRSTNATATPAAVTFQKLTVTTDASFDTPGTGNTAIWDLAFDPNNPNNLLATVAGSNPPAGGVFRSTNVLAATPTFTQTLTATISPEGLAMRLAAVKNGPATTVYAISNETSSCAGENGRLRKSTDGGISWSDMPAADGFCGGLCIFGEAVGVNPNNPSLVYLGGNSRGTCGDVLQRSTDGGSTFFRDDTGLNFSSHSIFIDPLTVPTTIWFACDGGVWKRQDAAAGTAWLNRNNSALSSLQFQSIAVHPTDANFTIGGTQDNGTEAQQGSPGNWVNAESGDGGFALIDQSATNTTNVTMYHTRGNLANAVIGFSRTNLGACLATKDSWEFRGAGVSPDPSASCDGTAKKATNGLNISDAVNFYPPIALGPGAPNTLYFGTDRLYRSVNRGDTMTLVSQSPLSSAPISAIAISRQNDNIRLVGTSAGKVFATITGSSTLTDITPSLPSDPNGDPSPNLKYISRVVIDPVNSNIAYLTLSYYTPAAQGIFKTTNLNLTGSGTVSWSAIGAGIPSIPIDAFVIDPLNSNRLFAGTDIGVYVSENGGATWTPYGIGLPRVAVFDLAIQPTSRILRAATHGRGVWEIPVVAPSAAPAKISGQVVNVDDQPLAGVTITIQGAARVFRTITDSNGRYQIGNLNAGEIYTVTPERANYSFTPAERSFSLIGDQTDAVFTGISNQTETTNPLDTIEFFVRQQYLDFLEREPDQSGFEYWSDQLNLCQGDAECVRGRRIEISAAFFIEQEFQDTGSFLYDLYKGSLNRRPTYTEYATDRRQVIGGPALDAQKAAFAESFVQRAEFSAKYNATLSREEFVDALLAGVRAGGIDLVSERANLINAYSGGSSAVASRAAVVRVIADNAVFKQAEYNAAFVLAEYFSYLRRNPDQQGYDFWLKVLNSGSGNNYRGMVCAFLTSDEYQRRFSSIVSHNNNECSGSSR